MKSEFLKIRANEKTDAMNIRVSSIVISCIFFITFPIVSSAQNKVWSVDECIRYALEKNIQVQKAHGEQ